MRTFDEVYEEMDSFTEAHQRKDELRTAFNTIRESGCRTYLEIGSLFGGSWFVLSQAMKPGLTVSVDLQNRRSCVSRLRKVKKRLEQRGFSTHALCGDSQKPETVHSVDRLLLPAPGPVAVFIDGDHDYLPSKSDYFAFRSYVIAKGGLIMFHDAYSPQGCARLWDEIEGSSPFPAELTATCSSRHMGIGILRVER